jgi:Flp pilus assembly protein TadG
LVTRWARHVRGEGGNVVIIFGLTLPIVIGGAALGVETSYWYVKDVQLQAAADAAAITAGIEKRSGSSNDVIRARALTTASGNGFDTTIGTMTLNVPPATGAYTTKPAVEVILDQPVTRYFTRIFSNSTVNERARAVAAYQGIGSTCILALNPTAQSILFAGSTLVDVRGCDVMSNSIAFNAIKTQGNSNTHAGCFVTTGDVDTSGGTLALDCAHALTHEPPIPDPFASVPAPTATGACLSDSGSTRNPGHYCGGMDLKNTVTLNPGVYYVDGGDFKVNANANVSGAGVTIYLSGGARLSMNGNSKTVLSAPTSGTYSGLLFFGDRGSSGGNANTVNGNDDSSLTGFLYFASQSVSYLGNFSGTSGCTRLVADTLTWSGNSTIDDTGDCSALGLTKVTSTQIVYLVE